MPIDPHRLAEARSLAAHQVIAGRLLADPALLDQARARVEAWLIERSGTHDYAEDWRELLAGDVESVARGARTTLALIIRPSRRLDASASPGPAQG